MADALNSYLKSIGGQVGFAVGDLGMPKAFGELQSEFFEDGKPGPGLELALQSMKVAWAALPVEVRSAAIAALSEAASGLRQGIDALGSVPLIGDVLNILLFAVTLIADSQKGVKKFYSAVTDHQLNSMQRAQFESASHPTQWVYAAQKTRLFEDRSCTGIGRQCIRLRPCLYPIGHNTAILGWDPLPSPTGNCSSGKQYTHVSKMDIADMRETDKKDKPCVAWAMFSALFFPFWSPNAAADFGATGRALANKAGANVITLLTEPLPVYSDPEYAGDIRPVDPNATLIQRQAGLLGDPISNLQADQRAVLRRHDRFIKWVGQNKPSSIKVDKAFRESAQQVYSGVPFYIDANGLMQVYAAARKEGFSEVSPIAKAPDYETRATAVTVGAYNCVVGMTRAFFTARAGFLRNQAAMKVYTEKVDGVRLVDGFDSAVRAAVKAAATPARAKKRAQVPPPRQQREGGGGGAAVALGIGGVALAAFLRRR